MMHARELKGGEAWSKEHVVSVEVSERGEQCPPWASHPGTAVPLVGTAREKISPAWEQGQGAKNGQRAGRGTALAGRKKKAGRAGERAARVVAGGGEQGQHGAGALWAQEFSSRQVQGEQLARGKHTEE